MYKCSVESCNNQIEYRKICKSCSQRRYEFSQGKLCDCGKQIANKSIRCKSCSAKHRVGSNHPNYGNGVKSDGRGYLQVLIGPKKYKAQHRLVMEAHIGRELDENENIHHKNGIRSDNRLENLELWSSSQPSGQRIRDLLDWAHQIIEKYEGVDFGD